MKTISITEFRRHFGKYLALSEREDFLISKKGKVVAKLTSPRKQQKAIELMRESEDSSSKAF